MALDYRSIADQMPDYAAKFGKKQVLQNEVQTPGLTEQEQVDKTTTDGGVQAEKNTNPKPAYQEWIKTVPVDKRGDKDYDLEAAYNTLPYEQMQKYATSNAHLNDQFKKPTHITFSTESQFSTPENKGGEWKDEGGGKWAFYASPANIKNAGGADKLQEYFNKYEPNSKLVIQSTNIRTESPATTNGGSASINLGKIASTPYTAYRGGKAEKTSAIQKELGLNPTGVWDNATQKAYLAAHEAPTTTPHTQYKSNSLGAGQYQTTSSVVPLENSLEEKTTTTEQQLNPEKIEKTYQRHAPVGFNEQIDALDKMRARIAADREKKLSETAEYQKLKQQYANVAGLADVGSALNNLYFTAGGTLKDPTGLTESAPVIQPTNWQQGAGNYSKHIEKLQTAGNDLAAKRLGDVDKKEADLREKYLELANKYYEIGSNKTGGDTKKTVDKQSQTDQAKINLGYKEEQGRNSRNSANINAGKMTIPFRSLRGTETNAQFKNTNEYNAAMSALAARVKGNPSLQPKVNDFVKTIFGTEVAQLQSVTKDGTEQTISRLISTNPEVQASIVQHFVDYPEVREGLETYTNGRKVNAPVMVYQNVDKDGNPVYGIANGHANPTGVDENGNPVTGASGQWEQRGKVRTNASNGKGNVR